MTSCIIGLQYRVLPISKEILTEGFETLTDPQDLAASPNGWHSDGTTSTTTTAYVLTAGIVFSSKQFLTPHFSHDSGNNAIAFKGAQTATTSQSSTGLNFIFTQNPAQAPTAGQNLDAARTNAFYVVNTVHDISYRYGFTEGGK